MAVSRLTQTTLQNGFEKFNRIWDERSAVGSMEAISAVTLSAAQASVEFNNIPGTYSHLQIRGIARSSRANSSGDYILINLNSDTGANYSTHTLYGTGASAAAGGSGSTSTIELSRVATSSHTASIFGATIIDILDYANTSKNKTVRCLGGYNTANNGSEPGYLSLTSGARFNTAAITSIQLKPNVGPNFEANSSFTLYGIK